MSKEANKTSKTCRRCKGRMREGQALQNTVSYGTPDFPGSNDMTGQTFSYSGTAEMVKVWKCEDCGYSVSWGAA